MNLNIKIGIIAGLVILIGITSYSFYYYYNYSTVIVESNLEETLVLVDGKEKGKAPQKFTLKKGRYKFEGKNTIYEPDVKEIDIEGGKPVKIGLQMKLKTFTAEEMAKLSPEEQLLYEEYGDKLTYKDEKTHAKNNPLTNKLPYVDPEFRFKIDYSGDIFVATYYITLYGYSQTDINENKKAAYKWIGQQGIDPSTLKIEISEEITTSDI